MKRALAAVTLLALTLPSFALASGDEETKFDPSEEWNLHTWGPELKIGPIDMSINKAVAYLMLGTVCSILIGIVLMRVKPGRGPNRRQALGETIYEVAQVQVAEQGLPTKAIMAASSSQTASVRATAQDSDWPSESAASPERVSRSARTGARSS